MTYVLVRVEDSVAVLFEHDAFEVIARIRLVVYELGIVEGLLLLLVAVTVVVVDEQEDSHVTEEGQLHGLLQKALLSLAVGDLTRLLIRGPYLTQTLLCDLFDRNLLLAHIINILYS